MSTPQVLALATGVPERRYSQQEIFEEFVALQDEPVRTRRARALNMIWQRAGVAYRHTAAWRGYFSEERTTEARNDQYMASAVPLAEATIRRGLDAAGYTPADVDELIVVSCTGFNIPGLDLLLAGRMGMRPNLHRSCILGMGCYGAFPGLLRARESVTVRPDRLAVMLSIELCSLHMQFDGSSESAISAALFSDGAGMALVGDRDRHADRTRTPGPRLIDSETYSDYTTLEHMSFTVTDHGFRMYLSSYVPDLLAAQIQGFIDTLLSRNNLKRGDVRFWGVHPGSTKIVDYVQDQLGLTSQQVEHSHGVLNDFGNMSSATIMFVLDRIHRCDEPEPGDYGVMMAFGPGLTMESLLVQW